MPAVQKARTSKPKNKCSSKAPAGMPAVQKADASVTAGAVVAAEVGARLVAIGRMGWCLGYRCRLSQFLLGRLAGRFRVVCLADSGIAAYWRRLLRVDSRQIPTGCISCRGGRP